MIKVGQLIKHKGFKDVAIYVTFAPVDDITGKCREFDGRWINLAFVKSYDIGLTVKETSGKLAYIADPNDWQIMHDDDFYTDCYRYARWRELSGQP